MGTDLVVQSTSIIWLPDLFLHFISVFGTLSDELPTWNEIKFSRKIYLFVIALFFLAYGIISIYTATSKLMMRACV